jgi:hypothetical protein
MSEEEAYLTVRFREQETRYNLVPPMGYNLDIRAGVVRVWDQDNTWVIGLEHLVALKLPNGFLKR